MTQQYREAASPWMMVAIKPRGKRVVIVGSGAIAQRRGEQFLSRGASVEIFDPNLEDDIEAPPGVLLHKREPGKSDLEGAWLVVVATNDSAVNKRVGSWADQLGVACNRTDDADAGTFAVPAMMEDDLGWKVAVLGGDAGPLFSAWVKGLIGHLATSERIGQVYTAMASARFAAETLPLSQKERAFLLRKVMARILETTDEVEGATLVRKLHAEK